MPTTEQQFRMRVREKLVKQQQIQKLRQKLNNQINEQQKQNARYELKIHEQRIQKLNSAIQKLKDRLRNEGKRQQDIQTSINNITLDFLDRTKENAQYAIQRHKEQLQRLNQQKRIIQSNGRNNPSYRLASLLAEQRLKNKINFTMKNLQQIKHSKQMTQKALQQLKTKLRNN